MLRHLSSALISLRGRGVASVQGADAEKFLQGMTSNNVNNIHPGTAIASMFLTAQGRILHDCFISKAPPEEPDKYYLDCKKDHVEKLISHLKKFQIRRKITIADESNEVDVFAVFENNSDIRDKRAKMAMIFSADERGDNMGHRAIVKKQNREHFVASHSEESYEVYRMLQGVAQTPYEMLEGDIPLENNCDYMNAVSFTKGCYIGQELTARTHFKSTVRKRLFPVVAFSSSAPSAFDNSRDLQLLDPQSVSKELLDVLHHRIALLPQSSSLHALDAPNTKLGALHGGFNGIGMALLRLNLVKAAAQQKTAGQILAFAQGEKGESYAILQPRWWSQEVDKIDQNSTTTVTTS